MDEKRVTIVHLTHSDPRSDSRVLKEMDAGLSFGATSVIGIGREDPALHKNFPTPPRLGFLLLDPPGSGATTDSRADTDIQIRNREINPNKPRSRKHDASLWTTIKAHIGFVWLPVKLSAAVTRKIASDLPDSSVDLIHVHDYVMLYAGTRLRRRTGAKLVYDAHELESATNGLSRFGGVIISWWERFLWKKIDGFITVSEGIREHYFARHTPKPSQIILNAPQVAPESTSLKNRRQSVRNELGLPVDHKIFVYLGYLSRGRGIEVTLEAFSRLPDNIHCAFIGTGDLADTVRSYGAEHKNIHLVNPVPHDQVVGFIASADFGICMVEPVAESYRLALPNKLFESILAGLPVLGSNLPEIARVISDSRAGTTTSLELDEVIKAIESMTRTTWKLDSSGVKALTWEAQVKKVHTLYTEIS